MKLLRECIRVLIEGYVDDQNRLIQLYPEYQDDIKKMKPKIVSWFTKRFGDEAEIEEVHPFKDCIDTLIMYDIKADSVGKKYRTLSQFKDLIDRKFSGKKWMSPADYIFMSVDDMESIMRISAGSKAKVDISDTEPDRSDYIGKFGSWNLWMPTTKENSVKIVGYDPETMESKATWCTTRITGSNLFYNYAGKGVILYYIIKDNPQSDADWLSVGFEGGKPNLSGENGGVSVDRANEGLKSKKLSVILGSQYKPLMIAMQNKSKEIGGEHPAKKVINKAAENLIAFENIIKGLGKQDRKDLISTIIKCDNVSLEILEKLTEYPDEEIRQEIVFKDNIPEHILEKLSEDESENVRTIVAYNFNTQSHVLKKLSNDSCVEVRNYVACNPNTSDEVIKTLCSDRDVRVSNIAKQEFNKRVQRGMKR
jgi:hypothetical protein